MTSQTAYLSTQTQRGEEGLLMEHKQEEGGDDKRENKENGRRAGSNGEHVDLSSARGLIL